MINLTQCSFVTPLFNPNTKELIPERLITLVAANGRKPAVAGARKPERVNQHRDAESQEDKNAHCQVDCFSVVSHPLEKRNKKHNDNNNSGIVLFSLSPRTHRIAPV